MENTNDLWDDEFYDKLDWADLRCIHFPEREKEQPTKSREKYQITLNKLNRTFKDFGIRMYAEPGEQTSA